MRRGPLTGVACQGQLSAVRVLAIAASSTCLAWPGPRTLAALTSCGSQVGSQRAATPGDARPCPATEAPGERRAGPRLATPSDRRSLYGMQEVWGSNPHSSTFPQLKEYLCRS